MPTMSPRGTSKATPASGTPHFPEVRTPRTESAGSPSLAAEGPVGRSPSGGMPRSPIIIRTSTSRVASWREMVSIFRPPRNTVMRSQLSSTSWILCVMKTTVSPPLAKDLRIENSPSTSWGVSMVVGSSRIRMSAP